MSASVQRASRASLPFGWAGRRDLVAAVAAVLALSLLGLVSLREPPTQSAAALEIAVRWPDGISLARDEDRLTLVMAVHPRCPSTHASVAELGRILEQTDGTFDPHLLVFHPADSEPQWASGRTLSLARGVPGLDVSLDESGARMARLGLMTSGHVLVYDEHGGLVFSGGITSGRQRRGANLGGTALLDLARGVRASTSAPVHGSQILVLGAAGDPTP